MPTAEEIKAAADAAAAAAAAPKTEPKVEEKTFTQADLAKHISEERKLAREKGQRDGVSGLLKNLEGFGIKDEASLVEAIKAFDEAKKAQMSELERTKADSAKFQAELASAIKERGEAQLVLGMTKAFVESKVQDHEVAELLYRKALQEDPKLDVSKFIEDLKAKRPALFGVPAEPPKANAGAHLPPGTPPPSNSAGSGSTKNAFEMTPDELRQYRASLGIVERM